MQIELEANLLDENVNELEFELPIYNVRYFWFWGKIVLTLFRVQQVKWYQFIQNYVKRT